MATETEESQGADVLLVEDNPDDLELTLRAFRKHYAGASIRVARDGAEAIEFAQQACTPNGLIRLKVILLDLKLPKIEGLEVLRRLRANPWTRYVPVVVMTSSKQDSDVLESYRLGVNSYIVKPTDFGQFTESVRTLGAYWLSMNQLVR